MKSGSGTDPFGEDEDDLTANADVEAEAGEDAAETEPVPAVADVEEPARDRGPQRGGSPAAPESIPYIFRRERVKEERNEVIQCHVRDFVREGDDDLHEAVEDELGTDVPLTDLREAALLFAQRHPEGVAGILREWGYEHK